MIFKHLQNGTKVQVWLYDNLEHRLEGKILGFDEFMNVVLDETDEVWVKDTKTKKAGDRNRLGSSCPPPPLLFVPRRTLTRVDLSRHFIGTEPRSITAQGREHYPDPTGQELGFAFVSSFRPRTESGRSVAVGTVASGPSLAAVPQLSFPCSIRDEL